MALDTLLSLRREGLRPDGIFVLVVGKRPGWVIDDETKAFIPATTTRSTLDLFPLARMTVAVLLLEKADALLDAILDALQEVRATPWGVVTQAGEVLMPSDDPAAKRNLYLTWEQYALCK